MLNKRRVNGPAASKQYLARVRCTAPEWSATILVDKDHVTCRLGILVNSIIFSDLVVFVSNDVHTVVAYGVTRTGRVQWASSWSNAQRRDTISQPASLP